ncbi:MAG: hypothetical protein CMD23_05100 [Flavobacteriales bacterium]|nr:hypothetical protein [Flavobacteriales bacterium]
MRFIIIISIIFFSSCFNPNILQQDEPFFRMQRTACYGTCPQYTVSIYNHGKITYNGKFFVDKIGCFSSFISDDEVTAIKLLLDDIDFFSLDKEYISPMTDIPSVVTDIYLAGKRHKVVDRLEGPKSLKKCYLIIDSIIDSIQDWSACESLMIE